MGRSGGEPCDAGFALCSSDAANSLVARANPHSLG